MGEVPAYNEDFVAKTKHVPVGSRNGFVSDMPAYKRKDWTQNEVYGSQYDNQAYQRISMRDMPHTRKEKEAERSWKKTKKTSDQYGQFYSPRVDHKGHRIYEVNKDLLPPPVPRLDMRYPVNASNNPLNQGFNTDNVAAYQQNDYGRSGAWGTPRGGASLPPITTPRDSLPPISSRDPYSDGIVRLPEIKSIDMNIKTTDFTSLNIYQGKYGYEHTSYPDGIRSFAVPDIREVNIRIQNQDGSYTNITTVPKRY